MKFLEFCDELYELWLRGGLAQTIPSDIRDELPNPNGDTSDYAPEPYLVFGGATEVLDHPGKAAVFLTSHPGPGENFQLRNAVNEPSLPLTDDRYWDVAIALGQRYPADPPIIASGARGRITGMLDFAAQIGKDAVIQVNLVPFHAEELNKRCLNKVLRAPGALREYSSVLTSFIARFETVIGLANVKFTRCGNKLLVKAYRRRLGVYDSTAERVPFPTDAMEEATIGLLKWKHQGKVRAVWCSSPPTPQAPGRAIAAEVASHLRLE